MFKKYDYLRPALLERMPPLEVARTREQDSGFPMTNGDVEEEDLSNSGLDDQSPVTQHQDSVKLFKQFVLRFCLVLFFADREIFDIS